MAPRLTRSAPSGAMLRAIISCFLAVTAACDGSETAPSASDAGAGDQDGSQEGDGGTVGTQGCDGKPDGSVENRIRYESDLVSWEEECVVEVQTRTCRDGRWSIWSGTFVAPECMAGPRHGCEGGVAHGTEQTRVRYASIEGHNECEAETQRRACRDGVFSAWTGTFTAETCVVCVDRDNDGFGENCSDTGPDCDDDRSWVNSSALEEPWNSIDENCDGELASHLEVVHQFEHFDLGHVGGNLHVRGDRVIAFSDAPHVMEVRSLETIDQRIARHVLPETAHGKRVFAGARLVALGDISPVRVFVHDVTSLDVPPVLSATIQLEDVPRSFNLSEDGKRLYITHNATRVYDLSDPSQPVSLGMLREPGCPTTLGLHDDGTHLLMHCTDGTDDDLWITSDLGFLPNPSWSALLRDQQIDFVPEFGARAFWVNGRDIYGLDLSVPSVPRAVRRDGAYSRVYGSFVTDDAVIYSRPNGDGILRICRTYFDPRRSESCAGIRTWGSKVWLANERYALVGGSSELVRLDFSGRPGDPELRWRSLPAVSIANEVPGALGGAWDEVPILIENDNGYATTKDGFALLDLEGFSAPLIVGGLRVTGAAVHEGFVYGPGLVDTNFPGQLVARAGSSYLGLHPTILRAEEPYLLTVGANTIDWYGFDEPGRVHWVSGSLVPLPRRMAAQGPLLYAQRTASGLNQLDVYRFSRDELIPLQSFRSVTDAFLPRDGELAWCADEQTLRFLDPESGLVHRDVLTTSYCGDLWDGGDLLFMSGRTRTFGSIWETGLSVLAPGEEAFVTVEPPADLEPCRVVSFGEGLMLCDGENALFVLEIVP